MDWMALILQTLRVGAKEVLKSACAEGVKDAYRRLRRLIGQRFDKAQKRKQGEGILSGLEERPELWQPLAEKVFCEMGIDKDEDIRGVTQDLRGLLAAGNSAEFSGDFKSSRGGMQIGSAGDVTVTHYHGDEGSGRSSKPECGQRGKDAAGGQEFTLPRSLVLTEEETDGMLWTAIQPEVKYPICAHPAVTHVSGVALVSFVTSAVAREIGILRDRFNTCGRQMTIESDPDPGRLNEFRLEVAGLKRDLVRVTQKGHLGVSSQGMLVGEAFKKVNIGSRLIDEIIDILSAMAPVEEGVNSLKITKRPDKAERARIKGKLDQYGDEIQGLSDRLAGISDRLHEFLKTVEWDWAKDLDVIWDQWCRPKPRQVRPCYHRE